MRFKRYLRWEFVLAATLVGCTSVAPNRIGLPSTGSGAQHAVRGSGPMQSQAVHQSELVFRIRWPMRTQAIPADTQSVAITVLSKDKTEVGSAVVQRGTSAAATASILVPTALGLVDVQVKAKDAAGRVVAAGLARDVVLRDNTATGVSVELSPEVDEVKIRQSQQLVLLRNLKTYFERYQNNLTYFNSREFLAAYESVYESFNDSATSMGYVYGWLPFVGIPSQPIIVGQVAPELPKSIPVSTSTALERLEWPEDGKVFEIVGTELRRFLWPDGMATWDFVRDGGRHAVDLTSDFKFRSSYQYGGTSKNRYYTEVAAGSWKFEPYFVNTLDGVLNGVEATRSIVFLGGERPDYNTVTFAKAGFGIDSQTDSFRHFDGEAFLDGFQEATATDLYQVLLDATATDSFPITRFPRHGRAIAHAPSLAATADIVLDAGLTTGNLESEFRIHDRQAVPGNFKLSVTAKPQYGTLGGKRAIKGLHLDYTLDDVNEQIRLVGTVDMTFGYGLIPEMRAQAELKDLPTGDVLATITYEMPFGADGVSDITRWSFWPMLVVHDDPDPAKRTKVHVTPAFLTGEATGSIYLNVR